MDLSTTYLGFELPHPLIPGACPLANDLDMIRHLEDSGAPMITLSSLFEEEIEYEAAASTHALDTPKEQFAEALSYLPELARYTIGPEDYLDHVFRVKQAVDVPVVASLNGTTRGGWLRYALEMEKAGADALELNLYQVATDPNCSGHETERESIQIVGELSKSLLVPFAVKLSPFYTSLPHAVKKMAQAGAHAIVLFNRFYQPDIDVEELELKRTLHLSSSQELNLRLQWLAIISGQNDKISMAVTGGVHRAEDVIKSVMCGADACQIVSALLTNGPSYLMELQRDLAQWMEAHEYESINQMKGSMDLQRCPSPHLYERANYMQILRSWESMQ